MKLELVALFVIFVNWGGVLLLFVLPRGARQRAEKILAALSVLGLLLITGILVWHIPRQDLIFLSALILLSAGAGYTLLRRWGFLG